MIVGASLAVASVAVVPGIAGAASASNCVPAGSVTEPGNCVTTPTVAVDGQTTDGPAAVPTSGTSGSSGAKTTSATTSSLPFTGADVVELAVVGTGAVLAGGVLMRRRRRVEA
jgi:LPXTG-motif cell wall-anchored protein